MEKPVPHPYMVYDYHQCRDYLQARDGYNERDYAGKYAGHPTHPYQDFWHYVMDRSDLHNDSFFTMDEMWQEGSEPWQVEILQKYLDTFADPAPPGERFIRFYVSW